DASRGVHRARRRESFDLDNGVDRVVVERAERVPPAARAEIRARADADVPDVLRADARLERAEDQSDVRLGAAGASALAGGDGRLAPERTVNERGDRGARAPGGP